MENDSNSIVELLECSDEELFAKIGQELHGDLFFPIDTGTLVNDARIWLSNKKAELQKCICTNEAIIKLAGDQGSISGKVKLIVAISDFIAALTIGVTPAAVSILIVREGLKSFCGSKYKVAE